MPNRLSQDAHGLRSHPRQFPDNLVIGCHPLLGRLIGHLERRQKPEHRERRAELAHAVMPFREAGHEAPMVIHVRHAVAAGSGHSGHLTDRDSTRAGQRLRPPVIPVRSARDVCIIGMSSDSSGWVESAFLSASARAFPKEMVPAHLLEVIHCDTPCSPPPYATQPFPSWVFLPAGAP